MENDALNAIGKTLYEMYLTLERIAQLQEKQCYAALKEREPASIAQQTQGVQPTRDEPSPNIMKREDAEHFFVQHICCALEKLPLHDVGDIYCDIKRGYYQYKERIKSL